MPATCQALVSNLATDRVAAEWQLPAMQQHYLRQWRDYRKLTQDDVVEQLAPLLITDKTLLSKLENFKRQLKSDMMKRLAEVYDCQPGDLLRPPPMIDDVPPRADTVNHSSGLLTVKTLPQNPMRGVSLSGEHDMPIYGVTMGAAGDMDDLGDDVFELNGEVHGYTKRPDAVKDLPDAFAIQVIGSSMSPLHEHGGVVVCTRSRLPSPGDDVVIELHNAGDGNARPSVLKRFVGKSAGVYILEQFNPRRQIQVNASRVARMFRVLSYKDLVGL